MSDDIDFEEWTAHSIMPTLAVSSIADACDFYASIGFEEEWRFPDPSPGDDEDTDQTNWTHACVSMGDAALMLVAVDADKGKIQRQSAYVFMDGVDAYNELVADAMGDEVPEPTDSDYGMRDFSIVDPWGHELTFGESLSDDEDDA